MAAIPLEKAIEYPTSDGQPMAETTLHREVMTDSIGALKRRYANVPDVWVGGNLFLCYRQGDPKAAIAPDVLLAKGVEKWPRPNYLLWEERPPSLVIEVTSRKTASKDLNKKKKIYQEIGVEEYVLFDPYEEYLRPRLQGFCLKNGRYEPIPRHLDGSLLSRTTGLTLRPESHRLRLVDTATGEPLLWDDELEAARVAEAEGRQAAEARVRALDEELQRLRRQLEGSPAMNRRAGNSAP